jgi:hypothetical protein
MASVLRPAKPSYIMERGLIREKGSFLHSKDNLLTFQKQTVHPSYNKETGSQSPLAKIRSSTPILNSSSQILVRNKTSLQIHPHNQGSHA